VLSASSPSTNGYVILWNENKNKSITSCTQKFIWKNQITPLVTKFSKFYRTRRFFAVEKGEKYLLSLDGQDSSVGIVSRYRPDTPRLELRWRQDFPYPSRPAPMLILPPVQCEPGLFLGVKMARAWCDHPPPDAQAEEWGKAIILLLCVPSGRVIETTSPSYITNLTASEIVYFL
jgi:hypothetical protein